MTVKAFHEYTQRGLALRMQKGPLLPVKEDISFVSIDSKRNF
jgi:hypothetical protein